MKFQTLIKIFVVLLISSAIFMVIFYFGSRHKTRHNNCLNDCMTAQGFDQWSMCQTYCYYQDDYKLVPCK